LLGFFRRDAAVDRIKNGKLGLFDRGDRIIDCTASIPRIPGKVCCGARWETPKFTAKGIVMVLS
jgi:hypothetical protein